MAKIDKLTPEQEAAMPRYVEKWTAIGLSTDPTDRPAAEAAINLCYDCAGLARPELIVWGRSPVEMGIIMARARWNEDNPSQHLGDWDLESDLGPQVEAFRETIKTLPDATRSKIRSMVSGVSGVSIYGQHDADFLSRYDFFRTECGLVEETEKLAGLTELAKHAGWCAPFEFVCFASDKPIFMARDGDGRLSNDAGPALKYADGFALYYLHGTEIPKEWVENRDTIDPTIGLTWPNIEQRRCAAEIIGWARVLKELDYRVIDENPDPEIGTLFECDIPDAPGSRFLRVKCGTGREFVIPTRDDIETAQEAQDFMWGLEPGEYKPEICT